MATIYNEKLGGVDFAGGEIPAAADWNATFDATFKTNFGIRSCATVPGADMVVFDDTKWQTTTHDSTDEGATWAANGGKAIEDHKAVARDNSSYAFSISHVGANAVFTTDKGANWNACAVPPANLNFVWGIDYPTSGMCVITGNATNGNPGIWFSTNGGNNWTQATTGPNDGVGNDTAFSVSMYDATNGFALGYSVANYDVYRTTDGAVNWTSVLANAIVGANTYYLSAISATEWAYIRGDTFSFKGGRNDIGGNIQECYIATGVATQLYYNGSPWVYAPSHNILKVGTNHYFLVDETYWTGAAKAPQGAGVICSDSDGDVNSWSYWTVPNFALSHTYSNNLWLSGTNKVVGYNGRWFYG